MTAVSNPTDAALVADLRERGLVGPISADFIADYRQHRQFADLLDEVADKPDGVESFKRALIRCRILPNPDPADTALVAAWDAFKSAERRLEETGPDASDEVDEPIWADWNAAAAAIEEAPAASAAGAIVKLRRALLLMASSGWVSRALRTDDDTTLFARAEEFECAEYLVVDAIAALAGSPDPHMGWLAERDAIWSEYNGYTDDDEARDEPLAAAARALEQRIIDTPAATRDGILTKALLIIGAAAIPGDDPDPIKVFDEAKAMGLMEWMA